MSQLAMKLQADLELINDEQRKITKTIANIRKDADRESRDLTDQERNRLGKLLEIEQQKREVANGITEHLTKVRSDAERFERGIKAQSAGLENATHEPRSAYEDGGRSFVADLIQWERGDSAAGARLSAHQSETRTMTTGDGSAGAFIPPRWLLDRYSAISRPGRVTANLVSQQMLPGDTMTVNIPRITTGSDIQVQTAENATIASVDMETDLLTANVSTFAGKVPVSYQMLDQAPGQLDAAIMSDLSRAHAELVNQQVLSGTGATGQLDGLLSATGVNTVTYTDADPTLPELYAKIADAVDGVVQNRYEPPTAIVMAPRRWSWALQQTDTDGGRPLIVPDQQGSVNGNAISTGNFAYGSPVGYMLGLPVYLDKKIPVDQGTGSDEDVILLGNFADSTLWSSEPRMEVFREASVGTLSATIVLWSYHAQIVRYPEGFAKITGTGLAL